MTTYNTGNPVGSVDVRDLYDNAEAFDKFSSGPLDAYPDRFGVSRQSLQGIRNASQYVNLGPYAAGLNFTALNQVFSYDAGSGAEFYAPGPSIVLPYTTTGIGAAEIANFRSVGDAVLRSDLAATMGAGLVGYSGRTVEARLDDAISVKDYDVVGDGVTDDTVAIQNAMNVATALGKAVFFPAGTYLVSGLNTLTNLKMVGEFYQTTILKLKNGSNAGILNHSGGAAGDDYIYVSGFTFDGNSANNTAGDCVTLRGIRPTLTDCIIKNAAERAVVTDWILAGQPVGYGGLTGAQGFFERITISNSQKTGWTHYAPTDSWFNCIDFLNCGLAADNTYYSFEILSNGRFSNIHPSNGAEYSVVPAVGVRVVSNGNNFSNCHFEGGYVPLHVVGDGNVFENCDYYAPRGSMCIDLSGTGNRITGITGATYFGGNPNYKGILLRGANNHVELTDIGCSLGVVDFTGDQGGNIVRVSGYHDIGVPYVGTPHTSDDVLISIGGPGGGKFVQQLSAPLSTYTPVVTPAGGAITSYTATGKYRKVGKLTELYLDITITNNGTGSGALLVSLPALPVDQGFLAGQEQAISGVSLCARVQTANANLNLTNYANANPGGTGARFLISGSYITEA